LLGKPGVRFSENAKYFYFPTAPNLPEMSLESQTTKNLFNCERCLGLIENEGALFTVN
jgi:hypothetical protein